MKLSPLQHQFLQHNSILPLKLHADFLHLQPQRLHEQPSAAATSETPLVAELAVAEPDTISWLTQDIQTALQCYAPSLTWRIAETDMQLNSGLLLTPAKLDAGQKRQLWQLITQYHEDHNDSTDPQRN
ncbi:hypothetical protein [Rheinheimera sp.]|uniref:hypothetical protein n=1 Tax=Rheinheimera sp. TaxID=1869214 RepID=UPI00307D6788